MDFKTSELIKKYWEADTSLQEEEQLKRELLSATNQLSSEVFFSSMDCEPELSLMA